MYGANVLDYGKFSSTWTPAPIELIQHGFKSYLYTGGSNEIEFIVDFGVSKKVHTMFINTVSNKWEAKGLNRSHIRLGDDSA